MAKQEEVTFVATPQPGIGVLREIRIFLWDTDGVPTPMYPGGTPLPNTVWADFGGGGLYRTSDPRAINKLRNNPDFGKGRKFHEMKATEKSVPVFSCPEEGCDYIKEGKEGYRSVIMHARQLHKKGITKEELTKVALA